MPLRVRTLQLNDLLRVLHCPVELAGHVGSHSHSAFRPTLSADPLRYAVDRDLSVSSGIEYSQRLRPLHFGNGCDLPRTLSPSGAC